MTAPVYPTIDLTLFRVSARVVLGSPTPGPVNPMMQPTRLTHPHTGSPRSLVHGGVEEEVGGQGLVALAQQEGLDAAVAVEAQRLQALHRRLLLLAQLHRHSAGRQPCAAHTCDQP